MANKDRTLFESFLDAFGKSESTGVKSFADLVGLEGTPSYGDIVAGAKYDPNRLYQDLEEQYGIDLTSGDLKNQSWLDNIVNASRNIATGIALDPSTYVPVFGLPAKVATKLGVTEKLANAVTKIPKFNIGEETAKKIVERTITGSTIGAMAYDEKEEDLLSNMASIGAGAGIGLTSAGKVGKAFGKGLEHLGDALAKYSAPEAFSSVEQALKNTDEFSSGVAEKFGDVKLSRAVEILRGAKGKLSTASRLYQEEMNKVYDILGGNKEALAEYEKISDEIAGATFKKRAELFEKYKKEVDPSGARVLTNNEALIKATEDVNIYSPDVADELLSKLSDPNVKNLVDKALDAQVRANNKFVQYYNDVHNLGDIEGLVGFDYHKYSFFDPEKADEAMDAFMTKFTAGFKRRKGSELGKVSQETIKKLKEMGGTEKDLVAIAGDRLATVFLDEHEKAARMLVAKYNQEVQKGTTNLSKMLNLYDSATKLLKSGQLGLGISFFFNQIPENITRASIATSPKNIINSVNNLVVEGKITQETADIYLKNAMANPANIVTFAGKISNKTTMKNILDDVRHRFSRKEGLLGIENKKDNKLLNMLTDIGVLNANRVTDYKRLASELPELFSSGATMELQKLSKSNPIGATAKLANIFEKTGDIIFKYSPATVLGGVYEDAMKVSVFDSIMRSALNQKDYNEFMKYAGDYGKLINIKNFSAYPNGKVIERYVKKYAGAVELARDIVEKSFVDYSNIKPWERQVMSRIIPYWSYMSRSIPFFLRSIVNPDTVDKMVIAEKFMRGAGSRPDKKKRTEMNEYLRDVGASAIPSTDKFYTQTANPLVESVGFASDPSQVFGKALFSTSPIIKAAVEQFAGREGLDTFALASGRSNTALIPTEDKPKKQLGNEAKLLKGYKGIGLPAIYEDESGLPYTTSELTARLASVKRNLMPAPFIDQLINMFTNENTTASPIGSLRKYKVDKKKVKQREKLRRENRKIIKDGLPAKDRRKKKKGFLDL